MVCRRVRAEQIARTGWCCAESRPLLLKLRRWRDYVLEPVRTSDYAVT